MIIKTVALIGSLVLSTVMQEPKLNNQQKQELQVRKQIVANKIKGYKVYQITNEDQKPEDGLLSQECEYNKDGTVKSFTNHSDPQGPVITYYTYGSDGQVTNEVSRFNDNVIQTIVYTYDEDGWLIKQKLGGESVKEFEFLYNEDGFLKEQVGYIEMGDGDYDGMKWRAQDNIVFTYNDKGHNIKTEYYFFSDIFQVSENEYNEEGQIAKTVVYDKNHKILGESHFNYDANNNLVLALHLSPEGENLYLKYVYEKWEK